jgi:hypothetical protein
MGSFSRAGFNRSGFGRGSAVPAASRPVMPIDSLGSTNRSARANLMRMDGIRYLPIDTTTGNEADLAWDWRLNPVEVSAAAGPELDDLALDGYYPLEITGAASPSLSLEWRLNVVVVAAGALAEDSFYSYQEFEVGVTGLTLLEEPELEDVIDLSALQLEWIRIARSINDTMWSFETSVFGATDPDLSAYSNVMITALDPDGNQHVLFSGLAPDLKRQYAPVADQTGIGGYGQEWFLHRQHPPAAYRVIDHDTPPEKAIAALLEGTRITARRIQPVAGYGSTVPADETVTELGQKKADTIEKLNALTGSILYVLPDPTGSHGPIAYWVREDEIDDGFSGLDLPVPVVITSPDPNLLGQITHETYGQEQYNRVIVRGLTADGIFIEETAETGEVTAGDPAVELLEVDYKITTTAAAAARAAELLEFYSTDPTLYRCSFLDRVDLRLYQMIRFIGFTEIPDTPMRIVRIAYDIRPEGAIVSVELAKAAALRAQKRLLTLAHPTGASIAADLVRQLQNSLPASRFGTVAAIVSSNCRVDLDEGGRITARLGGFAAIGSRVFLLSDSIGWIAIPLPTDEGG